MYGPYIRNGLAFATPFRIDGRERSEILFADHECCGPHYSLLIEWVGIMPHISGQKWRADTFPVYAISVCLRMCRVPRMKLRWHLRDLQHTDRSRQNIIQRLHK